MLVCSDSPTRRPGARGPTPALPPTPVPPESSTLGFVGAARARAAQKGPRPPRYLGALRDTSPTPTARTKLAAPAGSEKTGDGQTAQTGGAGRGEPNGARGALGVWRRHGG